MRLRTTIARKPWHVAAGVLGTLFLASLSMPLAAQQSPVKLDQVRKQLSQAGAAGTGAAQPQAKPVQTQAQPKPAASTPAATKTAVNSAKSGSGPAPAAQALKTAATSKTAPAAEKTAATSTSGGAQVKTVAARTGPRRDPFEPLVTEQKAGPTPENLPPGKAGLQITTLRLDGIVRSPNGMIAVVSNAQQRVYFLHDGDRLYDGAVERITMEGVSFHQSGTDPFGKPVERDVTKRLFPTPGEAK